MRQGKKVNHWILQNTKFDVLRSEKEHEEARSGIYVLFNMENTHCYVGQSKCIRDRIRQHFQDLRRNRHNNPYLQNAYNKYTYSAFRHTVLEYCSYADLDMREQYWIERLNPEYNISRNVFEAMGDRYDKSRDDCADYYVKEGETFSRPEWEKYVYGGVKQKN